MKCSLLKIGWDIYFLFIYLFISFEKLKLEWFPANMTIIFNFIY